MPLAQGRNALLECVVCQLARVIGEIAHQAVGRGRQEATPFHFEMPDRRSIAAARVVTRGGVQVVVDF
jgi:hypothetical protein